MTSTNSTMDVRNRDIALIAEAALFLDSVRPDWYQRVDTTTLDMNDAEQCVLGQAFADMVGTKISDPNCACGYCNAFGASSGYDYATNTYKELYFSRLSTAFVANLHRPLWIKQIEARREAALVLSQSDHELAA